jgi:predicted nucleic acid-binding protein
VSAKRRVPDANASKYLLFIDTNVWLDFYRMEAEDALARTLALIAPAKSRLITTDQVQMEFMKHRQKTILDMLARLKPADAVALPPIIVDKKAAQALKGQRQAMEVRRRKLRDQVEKILLGPGTHDPVFRAIQSLYSQPTDLVLCRPNEDRYRIRELAEKRWKLGYPPRKEGDTSMGDAINWEWLIDCANRRDGHVIIVSRDHDYGRAYEGQAYLNDWLQQEYKARVKGRGKVVLTQKLGDALKLMNVSVPEQVVEAEGKLLSVSATLIAGKATVVSNASGELTDSPD